MGDYIEVTCEGACVTEGDTCPQDCTNDPGVAVLLRRYDDDGNEYLECDYCHWTCLDIEAASMSP